MAKTVALDEVIRDLNIIFPNLDHECYDLHLVELAKHITRWRNFAHRLGFGAVAVQDLDHTRLDEQEKRLNMLTSWKEGKGSKATYRELATLLLDDSQRQVAETVLKLSNEGMLATGMLPR